MRVSRNTIKRYIHESSLGASDGKGMALTMLHGQRMLIGLMYFFRGTLGYSYPITGNKILSLSLKVLTTFLFGENFAEGIPIKLDMHQTFIPGQRCEFDYKGLDSGFGYIDGETGRFIQCRLFGMVLPCSQLFFARATLSEKQEDVFDSISCGFKYFGGVTNTMVFDNAKAQVTS